MIELVISGGQTGADRAGWDAAKEAGIPTSGFMPRRFKALDGFHRDFERLYGAKEHPSGEYAPRTRDNIEWADVTLVFAEDVKSHGTLLAMDYAHQVGKPCRLVHILDGPIPPHRPGLCAHWMTTNGFRILNVAGNRETDPPRIYPWVMEYLAELFRHTQS